MNDDASGNAHELLDLLAVEKVEKVLAIQRNGDEIALRDVRVELPLPVKVISGLHALCDNAHAEVVGEIDGRAHDYV